MSYDLCLQPGCGEIALHKGGLCSTHKIVKLRARLVEALDILTTIQQIPPERMGSREYGWMRDMIAAIHSTLERTRS